MILNNNGPLKNKTNCHITFHLKGETTASNGIALAHGRVRQLSDDIALAHCR